MKQEQLINEVAHLKSLWEKCNGRREKNWPMARREVFHPTRPTSEAHLELDAASHFNRIRSSRFATEMKLLRSIRCSGSLSIVSIQVDRS